MQVAAGTKLLMHSCNANALSLNYIVCHCVVLCCHTCPVACIPNEHVGILFTYPKSVSARCSCVQRACQHVASVRCKSALLCTCVVFVGGGLGCYAAACNINVNRHAVMRHFMHNMSPMFTQRFMLFVDS